MVSATKLRTGGAIPFPAYTPPGTIETPTETLLLVWALFPCGNRAQGIEKPYGFFDAKEGILRAPEILTDFRAAH